MAMPFFLPKMIKIQNKNEGPSMLTLININFKQTLKGSYQLKFAVSGEVYA